MEAFHKRAEAYRNSAAYEFRRHIDHQTGELFWTLRQREPVPLVCSILLGDALYNMHSALDHLMWRLAERATPEDPPERTVLFPIFKKRGEFWRKDRRTGDYTRWSGAHRLGLIPEDARQLVIELQPYQRGDESPRHPLWLLHELSNWDKHRTLHIASAATVDDRLAITKLQNLEIDFRPESRPLKGETEIGRLALMPTGPDAEAIVHPQFAVNEVFGEGGPAAGERIGATMNAIYEFLSLEVFEKRFVPYFGSPLIFSRP